MQRRLTPLDITWFLDQASLGRLDLEPAYQRRSVWTRRDQQFFLDTVFNNYPSPAIFLHKDMDDYGSATYRVVDGKQRIESILRFVNNQLPMAGNFGDVRIDGKRWKEISEDLDLRKTFNDYQVTVEFLDTPEPTTVNEIFSRLNKNSKRLTPQEVRHARYDGWFMTRAEQEVETALWKDLKVTTPGRAKRMQDTQFISELMILLIAGHPIGFDQNGIDEYYALYEYPEDLDPPFDTDDFNERFDRLTNYLHDMEQESQSVSRFATGLAHLYSLWSYLVMFFDELPSARELSERYAAFMTAVQALEETSDSTGMSEDVVTYASNIRGASTDLPPRLARLMALTAALQES